MEIPFGRIVREHDVGMVVWEVRSPFLETNFPHLIAHLIAPECDVTVLRFCIMHEPGTISQVVRFISEAPFMRSLLCIEGWNNKGAMDEINDILRNKESAILAMEKRRDMWERAGFTRLTLPPSATPKPSYFNSAIKDFTKAAATVPLPTKPRVMSHREVSTIGRFVLEELYELFDATYGHDNATIEMTRLVSEFAKREVRSTSTDIIAEQADALADIQYFCGDAAAKAGIPLDAVFDVVHAANMSKIDLTTGRVRRRPEDGKILKPIGWTPPDVSAVIKRAMH